MAMMIDGKTELEFAIQALEDIADPIAALRRYATKQGRQLDGHVAVQLSKDPGYLKGMASDALATLRRPTPDAATRRVLMPGQCENCGADSQTYLCGRCLPRDEDEGMSNTTAIGASDADGANETLAYKHAKAVGWNEAIEAAAKLVDRYKTLHDDLRDLAKDIRALDKSMQAIDD